MGESRQLSPRIWTYRAGDARPPVAAGALAIPQVQSAAFGDGRHPTTRLTAGALDVVIRARKPESMLDVGTGTGVLARIGRLRGVSRVAATDIDAVALEASQQNFALDDSPTRIELSDGPPDAWGPCFSVIVANILEQPLLSLAPRLAAALVPGGLVLLSGFTQLQAPTLRIAFETVGLQLHTQARLEEWVLLAFQKNSLGTDTTAAKSPSSSIETGTHAAAGPEPSTTF